MVDDLETSHRFRRRPQILRLHSTEVLYQRSEVEFRRVLRSRSPAQDPIWQDQFGHAGGPGQEATELIFLLRGSRIEEFLEGEEASFFALVDGENALPLESAQDHKRVGDGDTGPNTGGMGAYSPAPILKREIESVVMKSIILPTVKGMAAEGCKFVGVLFAGLMIEKKSGLPKLIEYNVRFGDPECQVLMMRLESDLIQVLLAACKGELTDVSLKWSPGSAMVVLMASQGYPSAYQKGTLIRNHEEAELVNPMVKIFHAGTALDSNSNFVASGVRVLGITAKGKDIDEARNRAYDAVEEIDWPEGFFRRDIGWRALSHR